MGNIDDILQRWPPPLPSVERDGRKTKDELLSEMQTALAEDRAVAEHFGCSPNIIRLQLRWREELYLSFMYRIGIKI